MQFSQFSPVNFELIRQIGWQGFNFYRVQLVEDHQTNFLGGYFTLDAGWDLSPYLFITLDSLENHMLQAPFYRVKVSVFYKYKILVRANFQIEGVVFTGFTINV